MRIFFPFPHTKGPRPEFMATFFGPGARWTAQRLRRDGLRRLIFPTRSPLNAAEIPAGKWMILVIHQLAPAPVRPLQENRQDPSSRSCRKTRSVAFIQANPDRAGCPADRSSSGVKNFSFVQPWICVPRSGGSPWCRCKKTTQNQQRRGTSKVKFEPGRRFDLWNLCYGEARAGCSFSAVLRRVEFFI